MMQANYSLHLNIFKALGDKMQLCSKNYYIGEGFNKFKFPNWNPTFLIMLITTCLICFNESFAQVRIPGQDQADKLEAAGTLLRLIDTGIFKWGARIFAGIAVLAAGHALMQQAFKMAVIAVVAAIVFGTSPIWVKNIFDIGGGQTLFSSYQNYQFKEVA